MRGRCGNAENFALTAKERKAHAPKPLPEIRPGALTPPLPLTQPPTLKSWSLFSKIKFSTRQETSDQLQSALIKKLPIELRQRIWRQVVGEKLLHVIRAHRTLLAIECPGRASLRSSTKHYACWGITSRNIELGPVPGYYITPQLSSTARHTSLLSLLKTCRLMCVFRTQFLMYSLPLCLADQRTPDTLRPLTTFTSTTSSHLIT